MEIARLVIVPSSQDLKRDFALTITNGHWPGKHCDSFVSAFLVSGRFAVVDSATAADTPILQSSSR